MLARPDQLPGLTGILLLTGVLFQVSFTFLGAPNHQIID